MPLVQQLSGIRPSAAAVGVPCHNTTFDGCEKNGFREVLSIIILLSHVFTTCARPLPRRLYARYPTSRQILRSGTIRRSVFEPDQGGATRRGQHHVSASRRDRGGRKFIALSSRSPNLNPPWATSLPGCGLSCKSLSGGATNTHGAALLGAMEMANWTLWGSWNGDDSKCKA
jgi:hypothetical protein